jgi:hypothetical protein
VWRNTITDSGFPHPVNLGKETRPVTVVAVFSSDPGFNGSGCPQPVIQGRPLARDRIEDMDNKSGSESTSGLTYRDFKFKLQVMIEVVETPT